MITFKGNYLAWLPLVRQKKTLVLFCRPSTKGKGKGKGKGNHVNTSEKNLKKFKMYDSMIESILSYTCSIDSI